MTRSGSAEIIVVSGLPRSGTSMMMQVLGAAGLEILSDGLRAADADNPRGYFELERVKKLEADNAWMPDARGKVIKVTSQLLRHLPADERYRVLFMRRAMKEILASQRQMLLRRGQPVDASTEGRMAEVFERHLRRVEEWLGSRASCEVIYVDYAEVVRDPSTTMARLDGFLGGGLDRPRMVEAVERSLHRQRSSE